MPIQADANLGEAFYAAERMLRFASAEKSEFAPAWSRRRWLSLSTTACVGAGTWLASPLHASSQSEKLLEEARSKYNRIVVTEQGSVRTLYFVVEGRRYIESRWDMSHPASLDLDYTRTMMAGFLLQPRPKRLMMMGLGGGQITNYLFHRFPDLQIDAVDIDPEVVRLAQKYFGVPNDPRYRCEVADGRLAIEQGTTPWDMIMLDAFRGVFVPYHLKTMEFYGACRDHLTPQGVVVANLHNRTQMYPRDRVTLARIFAQQYSFVSERGGQTTFVASKSPQRVGSYKIRANAKALAKRFDFDVLGLAARYYMRSDWELDAEILRDDFPPDALESAAQRHNKTCVHDCQYGY